MIRWNGGAAAPGERRCRPNSSAASPKRWKPRAKMANRCLSACSRCCRAGAKLPVEYTTVSLGKNAGFIAIGRNLQNIADLQTRLLDAQKAREQDFWRLRDIERRYRAVLDASSEAVALVRATTMRVVEANVAARATTGARSRRGVPSRSFCARSQGARRRARSRRGRRAGRPTSPCTCQRRAMRACAPRS